MKGLRVTSWLSIASLIPLCFLLLSWLVLDSEKSHRHFLSVGLVVSLVLIQLAFIIPLAADPELCYDAITPNGMQDSLACAWSGACFQAGGLAAAIWIVLRSLWFHIRVCWDRSPGRIFLVGSLVTGTVVPGALLIAATVASGYSYRLGRTCVINQQHSFAVFWGWLLAFAGLAFFIQCLTTGYAAGVYLRTMAQERVASSGAKSSISSGRQQLTGNASGELESQANDAADVNISISYSHLRWRKLRSMFVLQWRQLVISVLVVVESVYFVVVFWAQKRKLESLHNHPELQSAVARWGICLVANRGDKAPCLALVKPFLSNPNMTMASYILSALIGLQVSVILTRRTLFVEWFSVTQKFLFGKRMSSSLVSDRREDRTDSKATGAMTETHHVSISKTFFGNDHLTGGSNHRTKRRSYLPSWTSSSRSTRRQDVEQKEKWDWRSRPESTVLGTPTTINEYRGWKDPIEQPPRTYAPEETPKPDMIERPSSFRLETQAEMTKRLIVLETGSRDSTVLGRQMAPIADSGQGTREARGLLSDSQAVSGHAQVVGHPDAPVAPGVDQRSSGNPLHTPQPASPKQVQAGSTTGDDSTK